MSLVFGGHVSRSGLISYLDTSNKGKCWLGVPSTNSLLYSNDFTFWNKSSGVDVVPASWEMGPFGFQNAKRITANGTTSAYINRSSDSPVAAGDTLTKSIYAKAGTLNTIISEFNDNAAYFITTFNVSTGSITRNDAGNTATIESCGNGWFRCSVTRTFIAASSAGVWYLGVYGTSPAGYIFLHGAQQELHSGASRLIETNGVAVTRTNGLVDLVDKNIYTQNSLLYGNDSFSFNDSPSSITRSITSAFFRDSSWTVSVVVKFYVVNKGSDNGILSHVEVDGVTNKHLNLVERAGKIYYGFYGNDFQTNMSVSANVPYLINFTYNPVTLKQEIYINGVLAQGRTASTAYTGVSSTITVASCLSGELPMMMIHDRVLSASEINILFVTNKIKFGL